MEDSLRPPTITPDSPFSRRRSRGVSLHGSLMTMSIIELMHQIVKEPAPRLMAIGPDGVRRFPIEAEEFVDACLDKEPEKRGMPGGLAVSYSSAHLNDLDLTMFLAIQMDRDVQERPHRFEGVGCYYLEQFIENLGVSCRCTCTIVALSYCTYSCMYN